MEMLEKKATDLLASILIDKFTTKEIEELIQLLEKSFFIESPNMGLENQKNI